MLSVCLFQAFIEWKQINKCTISSISKTAWIVSIIIICVLESSSETWRIPHKMPARSIFKLQPYVIYRSCSMLLSIGLSLTTSIIWGKKYVRIDVAWEHLISDWTSVFDICLTFKQRNVPFCHLFMYSYCYFNLLKCDYLTNCMISHSICRRNGKLPEVLCNLSSIKSMSTDWFNVAIDYIWIDGIKCRVDLFEKNSNPCCSSAFVQSFVSILTNKPTSLLLFERITKLNLFHSGIERFDSVANRM